MARTIKIPCPEKPIVTESNSKTYTIHVVTPLFSGGVEARKNDPVTLIRGSSIRGQLRFWWRATRGIRFNDSKELKIEEGKIWGTTDNSSKISIKVNILSKEISQIYDKGIHNNFPSYSLFPFITENGAFTRSIKFNLTVTWTSNKELRELEPALWAWVNFGGLGARTRRGCGALFCESLAPPSNCNNFREWYDKNLKRFEIYPNNSIRLWPTLPGVNRIKLSIDKKTPIDSWKEVIETFKNFRQGKEVGRNKGSDSKFPQKLGRSRWPEADSIRRLTHKANDRHKETNTTKKNAFPRAEFGLPIIFEFKTCNDPDKTELHPVNKKRMSSPIILKPLCIRDNLSYSIILWLQTSPLDKIELEDKMKNKKYTIEKQEIQRPDLKDYPNSPMKNRTNKGSAIEAFMKFAEDEEGYR